MTDRKDKINTCMRGFLIFVNSLFMLFGIAIVVAGVYLLTSKWADIDPDLMKKVGAGLIGVGLLALFMACAGCVGAMKKIKCLLITYMMFVFLVMAACGAQDCGWCPPLLADPATGSVCGRQRLLANSTSDSIHGSPEGPQPSGGAWTDT